MATRIGINGFGRMGRLSLRAGWGRPGLEFVHINEVAGGPADGGAPADLRLGARPLAAIRDGQRHRHCRRRHRGLVLQLRAPRRRRHGREQRIDIVLECTGKFRTAATLEPYFAAGVRKVIVAAPGEGPAR
jgi:glyceraldehyde 3-phosphate dehydrogenase